MSHCLCSCRCCIHNVLLTVEHFQFFAKEFFARDSRWWNSIRAEGGHKYYRPFVTGLYISFDKSKSVLFFPCDVIYVGRPV